MKIKEEDKIRFATATVGVFIALLNIFLPWFYGIPIMILICYGLFLLSKQKKRIYQVILKYLIIAIFLLSILIVLLFLLATILVYYSYSTEK